MAAGSDRPAWATARPTIAAASYDRSAAGALASNFENGGYSRAKYSVDGVFTVPDDVPYASFRCCGPTSAMNFAEFMPSFSRNFFTPPCEIQVRAMVVPSPG